MEDANWMEESDYWDKSERNSQQEARGCSHPSSVFLPLPKSLWSFTQGGQAVRAPGVSSDPQAAQPFSPAILKELKAKSSERTRGGVLVSNSRCTSAFAQNNPGVEYRAVLMPVLVVMGTGTTASHSVCTQFPDP